MYNIQQQIDNYDSMIDAALRFIEGTKKNISNIRPEYQELLDIWRKERSYKSISKFKGRTLVDLYNYLSDTKLHTPFQIPFHDNYDVKIIKEFYKSIRNKGDIFRKHHQNDGYIMTSNFSVFEFAISNYLERGMIIDSSRSKFAIFRDQLPRISRAGLRTASIKAQMPETIFEEWNGDIFLVNTTEDDLVYWLLNGGSEVPSGLLRR